MSEPLSAATLTAIEARANAATEGPWHWAGNTDVNRLYLATWIKGWGRCTVMDFARWGMQSARPRFADDMMMQDADKHVVFEVAPDAKRRDDPAVYRADVSAIDHPDAVFIAAAREDISVLLAEVHRLQEQEAAVLALHQKVAWPLSGRQPIWKCSTCAASAYPCATVLVLLDGKVEPNV